MKRQTLVSLHVFIQQTVYVLRDQDKAQRSSSWLHKLQFYFMEMQQCIVKRGMVRLDVSVW